MQDLLKIEYKDWFINQKRTPDKESAEYKEFYNFHKRLCTEGCMIGDTFFNPFLMWHLNFWHTSISEQDEKGRIYEVYGNPSLRDNEWMVTNEIHKAEQEHKGLVIFGIRRFSKSTLESSYIAWGATFDENSQNIIAGLNGPDIKVLTDMIDKGLTRVPDAWRWQRIEDNWKNQVTLGIKTKDGMRIPFSSILIRNLDDGNNQEAIAGTKPRKLIIDEGGKGNFLKALQAAIPGFTTPYGWGCSPIVTGCVCAGTKVWDNEGNLINIEDLVPEKGILGYNGKTISKEEITYWQPPKETDCYRITTNKGTVLECSYDHPILFRSRNEKYMVPISKGKRKGYRKIYFKETKEINVGDQIALIDEVPLYGTKKMWEPRLVGWLIGDGSYGLDKTPRLSNCDKYINDYIENNFEVKCERSYLTKENKEYKETRIKNICPNLRELGVYGQTKDNKTLPIDIHSYTKEDICELLGGFFDTDGCVSYGGIDKPNKVFLTAAYSNILLEVKLLLQKLGIHSNLQFNKPNPKNRLDRNGWYNLGINDRRSLLKFYELISFKINYKQEKLIKIVENLQNKKEKIPIEVEGLRFENVASIEYIGIKPVYNLTAGTTNTYIANGIVTHNTGGDMKKFMDAKSLFFDTDQYNFMTYNNAVDTKTTHGLFISNKYRLEAKEQSTMADYLQIEDKSLKGVPIMVSNEEKANKILEENLVKLKRAGDRNAYLKEKMYYPKEVDDIFLNEDTNIFNILSAQRQAARLRDDNIQGSNVFLEHDGEKIIHKFTNKMPVTNYPHKPNDDTDAPIVIYEMPIKNPPFGLYVAGVDPYRQANSKMSSSLGAVYILKRMHDIQSEKFQDMIVASYVSRPENKDKWNEQARMLIKYYNARTLVENDEMSFIEYMKNKGDAQYLERQPPWLKEIVPNTTVNRDYGIHRSSQKVIDYMHNCLKEYLDEVIYSEKDEKGSEIREVLGVARIRDRMLLEEIIQFTDDGNFDRIVSVELAIALANHLDNIIKVGGTESDSRIKELYNKAKKMGGSLFGTSDNLFKERKSKLWL